MFPTSCFFSSCSPTPTINWFKRGGDLPLQKVKFENFNKTLRILNVSEEDSGSYNCMASNKMGVIRHSVDVQVKGEPMRNLLFLHFCQFLVSFGFVCCPVQLRPIGQISPPILCLLRMRMDDWCVVQMGTQSPPSNGC